MAKTKNKKAKNEWNISEIPTTKTMITVDKMVEYVSTKSADEKKVFKELYNSCLDDNEKIDIKTLRQQFIEIYFKEAFNKKNSKARKINDIMKDW